MWDGRDTQELVYGASMTLVGFGMGSLLPVSTLAAIIVIGIGLGGACASVVWLVRTLSR